jgi:hypothetical protein
MAAPAGPAAQVSASHATQLSASDTTHPAAQPSTKVRLEREDNGFELEFDLPDRFDGWQPSVTWYRSGKPCGTTQSTHRRTQKADFGRRMHAVATLTSAGQTATVVTTTLRVKKVKPEIHGTWSGYAGHSKKVIFSWNTGQWKAHGKLRVTWGGFGTKTYSFPGARQRIKVTAPARFAARAKGDDDLKVWVTFTSSKSLKWLTRSYSGSVEIDERDNDWDDDDD